MTLHRALASALTIAAAALVFGCAEGGTQPAAPSPTPTPAPAPAPPPAPAPAPVEPVMVSLIELNPQEISGQSSSVATVTLTGPAPEGGALVNLQSTNKDVAKVPATLLIPAGETSGTARVETSTIQEITRVNIIAQYGGASNGATLTVGFDPLFASFKVTPNLCDLLASGRLQCDFDARASKGRISAYRWTVRTTNKGLLQWESNGNVTTPVTTCDFWRGLINPPNPFWHTFTIMVELQVVGRNGELSNVATMFVDVWAQRVCGYP